MFKFQSTIGNWKAMPQSVDGEQLFTIGDIHGQAGALRAALSTLASIPRIAKTRRLVLLGDLIDRGPASLEAIGLLDDAKSLALVDDVVMLPGNHELMLLDALEDPMMFMGDWLDNGGEELILEAEPNCAVRLLTDFAEIARRVVPQSFLNQMKNGPSSLLIGDVLMVHAGLNPELEAFDFLSEPRQAVIGSNHWAWIREPFLSWQGGWGPRRDWAVIHGHTPAVNKLVTAEDFETRADKLSDHSRICLDAGAAKGIPQVAWAEFQDRRYRFGVTNQGLKNRISKSVR
jgi:serine/threonine protein phosphatase 1